MGLYLITEIFASEIQWAYILRDLFLEFYCLFFSASTKKNPWGEFIVKLQNPFTEYWDNDPMRSC